MSIRLKFLMQVISIFTQYLRFFSFIGPFFQSYSEARGAAAPAFRLIDEGNDASINETDVLKQDTESFYNINGDIKFDNVNFIYPSRKEVPVLHNLSLIARAGQTTALVGTSGSGKSTCISLFLRYYEPSCGQITIGDRPITDYTVKQLRKNIGVVSQEPILFGMSIYENIRFGKVNATRAEIEQAAREANAHNFIMQLPNKYETLVGERGIQLSGGEKQRIALARALVKQPTFLLLDEATSALDNMNENIVQEALDRACKGRTTIVIAHRLTTIQNAHQIYVLDNGHVIEQGTHKTLMAKEGGKYQAMVKRQQMERIDDDRDDMISIQEATEEDIERSHLLNHSQTADVKKQFSKPFIQRYVFLRLLSMNSPEWITILIGCIACVLNGAAQPLFAVLLAKIVDYTAFAIAGSKLTQRIRSKAFACLLRQEVAYFDRPENSSGAICARLSSDASAIQQMTGTRLGVICEAIALSFFGILFGCLISWPLTLIISGPLFIVCLVAYGDLCLRKWLNQQSGKIIGRASTLAVEVIHNMRTIKQLLIETEVLRQYSELMHEIILETFDTIFNGIWYSLDTSSIAMSISAAEQFFDLFDRKPAIDNTSTEGQELLLDEIDIRQLNLQSVRSQFGLVSQEPILFDLTIAENIAYGLENVSMEDIIHAASRANIHQFIDQLPQGYETKVGSKGSFLSGGEKQRIAIARILLRRPKILLLDEATSAMDSYNEQIIQEALAQAQSEDPSRTSLTIAHRLSIICSCDLLCVLDKGRIVERGTHTELIQRRGVYYNMVTQNNLQ
ncbi:unnamed protein product [Rotaria sp. Silwood1]|nr:unnamed protein product [Rotaria sp. Silwood1]